MSARVTLFQYRNLLRLAKQENLAVLNVSPALNQAAIATLCPPVTGLKYFGSPTLSERTTVAEVIRASFRECLDLDDARQVINAQHRAHNAIQFLNRITHQFRDKADRTGVEHHVGQIVLHKNSGVHYVVVGWDRTCKQRESIPEESLRDGHEQPFFHVLPHHMDCERRRLPLGKAYVAQELLVMSPRPFVSNPKIGDYFDRYCSETQRFVPRSILKECFPDETYPTGDVDLQKYVKSQAKRQHMKRKLALSRYAQQGRHHHRSNSQQGRLSSSQQLQRNQRESEPDSNRDRDRENSDREHLQRKRDQQQQVQQQVAKLFSEPGDDRTSVFLEAVARHGESSLQSSTVPVPRHEPDASTSIRSRSVPVSAHIHGNGSMSARHAATAPNYNAVTTSNTLLGRRYQRPSARKLGGSRVVGMKAIRRSGHTHACRWPELDPVPAEPRSQSSPFNEAVESSNVNTADCETLQSLSSSNPDSITVPEGESDDSSHTETAL